MRSFCEVMAKRGYVVASVNYRKGWRKDSYVPAPNCLLTVLGMDVKCLYAADSSERYRAVYRGMQDVKGAIRWLKARAGQDSTCPQKVLVGGVSAGAIISFAVALLDRPEEKPASCYEIADVSPPYAPNVNCYEGDACQLYLATPADAALKRPDLGPIEGRLNLNGFDAGVLGIISFIGGMPYEAHANSHDWLKEPDTPALYLYHRTCDAVVPFGYGRPMSVLSLQCNTGCTPWHYNNFSLFGSGAIASIINALPASPPMMSEFFSCQPLLGCLDYFNNDGYHNILNPLGRAQKIAEFFSLIVLAASCKVEAKEPSNVLQAQVSPNPYGQRLSVFTNTLIEGEVDIRLSDISGRAMWSTTRVLNPGENVLFEKNHFSAGGYVLQLRSKTASRFWKVVRE